MAGVLEGAHALERIAAADVDVGRGDVDPELDPQRTAELQLRLEPALGQDVDGVPRQVGDRHRGYTSGRSGAAQKKESPAETAPHPQAQAARAALRAGAARVVGVHVRAADGDRRADPVARPDPAQKEQANTYVYASDGHTILAILRGSQARVIVPSTQISPLARSTRSSRSRTSASTSTAASTCAASCARSGPTSHGGLVQGGSTITQQFVKNAINGNAPTIARKLKEAALAWQLEQEWSKDKILTAYLNTIYFGNGAYGVEQACRVYFGHTRKTVNPAEAALLAGHPGEPEPLRPGRPSEGRACAPQPRAPADVPPALPRPRPVPAL